jgi:hypothetical protein
MKPSICDRNIQSRRFSSIERLEAFYMKALQIVPPAHCREARDALVPAAILVLTMVLCNCVLDDTDGAVDE